jgi:hypothetical protein
VIAARDVWGPWRPDLDPAERIAHLEMVRPTCRTTTAPSTYQTPGCRTAAMFWKSDLLASGGCSAITSATSQIPIAPNAEAAAEAATLMNSRRLTAPRLSELREFAQRLPAVLAATDEEMAAFEAVLECAS